MASNVVIPKAQQPALKCLLGLPRVQAQGLLAALRSEQPSFYLETMASRLAAKLQLPSNDLADILMMLASMYLTSRSTDHSSDDFATGVIHAAKDLDSLKDATTDWDHARQLIAGLLACDTSLGVTAKAISVTSDHEKLFSKARILTDMRPIFGDKIEERPAAAIVVHTLRITYRAHPHQRADLSSFFVAMNAEDLRELQTQIARALAKEQAIGRALAAIDLQNLSTEEE